MKTLVKNVFYAIMNGSKRFFKSSPYGFEIIGGTYQIKLVGIAFLYGKKSFLVVAVFKQPMTKCSYIITCYRRNEISNLGNQDVRTYVYNNVLPCYKRAMLMSFTYQQYNEITCMVKDPSCEHLKSMMFKAFPETYFDWFWYGTDYDFRGL